MSPSSQPSVGDYMLSNATDRDRLYLQFDLFRDWFRGALAKALAVAGVDEERPWRALDIACGEGLYAADIEERCPHASVVGFDRDPEAILTARTAFSTRSRVQFQLADVHEPLVPVVGRDFDVAYALCAVAHFKDAHLALQHVFQTLRPGAAVLLLDPTERLFEYPHPSLEPLALALKLAWGQFGTYAAGERAPKLLADAGFIVVHNGSQDYVLGGDTPRGKAKFLLLTELFSSLRTALVERARTIDGAAFDDHLASLRAASDPARVGTYFYRTTLARKPA